MLMWGRSKQKILFDGAFVLQITVAMGEERTAKENEEREERLKKLKGAAN